MSVRDGVISLSKEPLWPSALVSHVEPLLLSATSLGHLFAANSLSASNSSESEFSPVDRDVRVLAGSAVLGVWVPPFCFNDLSDSPISVMFLFSDWRTASIAWLVLEGLTRK